jgi:16S rRNA (cytosine1402-N4)-methyltransferase
VLGAAACLEKLPADKRKVWDGTAGLGGHLEALSDAYPSARLFASDADAEILKLAEQRLGGKVAGYRHGNFSAEPLAVEAPFGLIFLDLGISSAHFDYFERGFSFRFNQPLDMRMDQNQKTSAADLLAVVDEEKLARIFFEYGDEKFSRRIAREIVSRRKTDPVTTTFELAAICEKIYPPKYRAKGHAQRHPATRAFQALRIAVNGELAALETALKNLPHALCAGGRLAIITFHSLEDRMVKRAFRDLSQIAQKDPRAKSNFIPGDFTQIEPGGVAPLEAEIEKNPRARSARLRVLERLK